MSYLLELSSNKRILNEYDNSKGEIQCKTIPLIFDIISKTKISLEGQVMFSSISKESICYVKNGKMPLNDFVYFDLTSIFSNCVYHFGLWSHYPNISEYYQQYIQNSNQLSLLLSEKDYIYKNINQILHIFPLIPKRHLFKLSLVFSYIIKEKEKTKTN